MISCARGHIPRRLPIRCGHLRSGDPGCQERRQQSGRGRSSYPIWSHPGRMGAKGSRTGVAVGTSQGLLRECNPSWHPRPTSGRSQQHGGSIPGRRKACRGSRGVSADECGERRRWECTRWPFVRLSGTGMWRRRKWPSNAAGRFPLQVTHAWDKLWKVWSKRSSPSNNRWVLFAEQITSKS